MTPRKHFSRRTLTDQVVEELRKFVVGRAVGERIASERELSEQWGVSTRTIREAVGALVHEGLLDRRHGSGTYIVDSGGNRHIALIVGSNRTHPELGFYVSELIDQFHALFGAAGRLVRTYWATEHEDLQADPAHEELAANLKAGRVQAVILIKGPLDDRWRGLLREAGTIPQMGGHTKYSLFPYDRLAEFREILAFFQGRGRRRVALLSHFADGEVGAPAEFRAAAAALALPIREAWLQSSAHPTIPGAGYEGFKDIWRAGSEKPDALIIADDHFYSDAATAILEMGIRAPTQCEVAVFSVRGSGMFFPFPTHRMEIDPAKVALAAQDTIEQLLAGKTPHPASVGFDWKPAADAAADSPRATLQPA